MEKIVCFLFFLILVALGINKVISSPQDNIAPKPYPEEKKNIETSLPPEKEKTKPAITVGIETKNPATRVNIREKPATESAIISKAKRGEEYQSSAKENGWYQVTLENGASGWINSECIVLKENQ